MKDLNPYEPSLKSEKVDFPFGRILLDLGCYGLYLVTIMGFVVLAYLPIRYPGLNDRQSGPAYYWPDDLFNILLRFELILLGVTSVTFLWRRNTSNRHNFRTPIE